MEIGGGERVDCRRGGKAEAERCDRTKLAGTGWARMCLSEERGNHLHLYQQGFFRQRLIVTRAQFNTQLPRRSMALALTTRAGMKMLLRRASIARAWFGWAWKRMVGAEGGGRRLKGEWGQQWLT